MGEFELLARIRERIPAGGARIVLGSGDDAAVTVPEGATATSVDAVVDGVHFHRDQATPAQIGHKALATALSDLAAMGAEPGEAYVTLGLPPDFGEDECIELLDGLLALAAATGTSLAGGDLTRSATLFLAIAVVGHAPTAAALVSRGGARPGDALILTGELGGAAAGLALLDADTSVDPPRVGSTLASALIKRQLEPQPRLAAGRALARAGVTAMIDISDGLGGDAGHLAAASGVGLHIDAGTLPRPTGLDELAGELGRDPWQLLLSGGEDYELLASVPTERLEQAIEAVRKAEGIALTRIGEVVAGSGIEIRLPDGGLADPGGFDQLA
ncbi:MAG TPA: thiamine-phosphate kinase [Solirubrobacterales bacterium]|nr:thiamine-phosphate kinase [Solirubrobacterales bacterium]